MRAHLLVYDIPQKAKMGNPSYHLRHYGVRVNLSAWIIPDNRIAMVPIDLWREKGAKVELVRFDERDGETIIRLAREALKLEITTMEESLRDGIKAIRDALAKVASGDEEALAKVSNLAGGHVRRADKAADAAEECSALFGLTADVKPLIDGLRELVVARREMYRAMLKAAKDNMAQPTAEQLTLQNGAQS